MVYVLGKTSRGVSQQHISRKKLKNRIEIEHTNGTANTSESQFGQTLPYVKRLQCCSIG